MASTPTCGGRRSSLDPPKIEVRRLRYEVGSTEILAGVDALVPDGAVTAVVGPSGAGRSALLRVMVGMIIAGADPLEAVRLQIVVLYMLLGSAGRIASRADTATQRKGHHTYPGLRDLGGALRSRALFGKGASHD
jgi:energy-coupling factor transporter ATP-binding protein EcfA2